MTGTPLLVDTNLLLRNAQPTHPQFATVTQAISALRAQGCSFYLVPQVLYEFWVVATRPTAQNGLGLTPVQAHAESARITALFRFLNDQPTLYVEWQRLVTTYAVSGKEAHDARLVAAMKTHGLSHLLTFNDRDFARYAVEGIVAINPATVPSSLPNTS